MLYKTLLFASTASATCLHGLSMFKRAEGKAKIGNFGYGPLNGPFNWASIAPENEACKMGKTQSPINIDESVTVAPSKPILNIPDQEVEFENLGTTIEVIVNGTTKLGSTDYRLVQFHMHTPSEHHINGEYHPLEIHMVHQGVSDTTQLAVLALMFQVTSSDSSSIIKSLSPSIEAIRTPGSKATIATGIDFTDVTAKIAASDVLQYTGSLTTPPCAEGVTFLIAKDPLDISAADYNAIKSVVKFNSRFIQNALGGANMLEVADRAGTARAFAVQPGQGNGTAAEPPAKSNGTAVAAGPPAKTNGTAGPPTPGTRFMVTELYGQHTSIAAIVARKPKYSL